MRQFMVREHDEEDYEQRQQKQLQGSGGGLGTDEWLTPLETKRGLGGLLRAMWDLQWPIPTDVTPDSRYATLLQISIGQEDVDEVRREA